MSDEDKKTVKHEWTQRHKEIYEQHEIKMTQQNEQLRPDPFEQYRIKLNYRNEEVNADRDLIEHVKALSIAEEDKIKAQKEYDEFQKLVDAHHNKLKLVIDDVYSDDDIYVEPQDDDDDIDKIEPSCTNQYNAYVSTSVCCCKKCVEKII